MKKKTKLGEPHSEATPEARSAANKKNVNQKYHLSQGDGNVDLSENDNKDPQSRAASRGAKAPKKRVPTNPWN